MLRSAITRPFRKRDLYRELRQMADIVVRPWSETEIDMTFVDLIASAIEEDGSLTDSASQDLMSARGRYKQIWKRLEQLLQSFPGEIAERSGRHVSLCIPSGTILVCTRVDCVWPYPKVETSLVACWYWMPVPVGRCTVSHVQL